jgi:hypothetical protein
MDLRAAEGGVLMKLGTTKGPIAPTSITKGA